MESRINTRSKVSDAKAILYRVVVFVGLLVLISFLLEGCTMNRAEEPAIKIIKEASIGTLTVLEHLNK